MPIGPESWTGINILLILSLKNWEGPVPSGPDGGCDYDAVDGVWLIFVIIS